MAYCGMSSTSGHLIYNRQKFVKDPTTGRRIPRPNPKHEWVIVETPELQIVDRTIWDTVRAIKTSQSEQPLHQRRKPRRLLSGLLACGVCGGSYTVIGEERVGCATRREKGTCSNSKTMSVKKLEERVLTGLRERLLAPELLAEFAAEYQREFKRLRTEMLRNRAVVQNSLSETNRRIDRIVSAIEHGSDTPAMHRRLVELEQDRSKLEHESVAVQSADNDSSIHAGFGRSLSQQGIRLARSKFARSEICAASTTIAVDRSIFSKPSSEQRIAILPEKRPSLLHHSAGVMIRNGKKTKTRLKIMQTKETPFRY